MRWFTFKSGKNPKNKAPTVEQQEKDTADSSNEKPTDTLRIHFILPNPWFIILLAFKFWEW